VAPGSVTDELEKQDQRVHLRRALAQLPDHQRRALTAHFVEGRSVREIAGIERIPVGTVLSRIHSAKQHLREAWDAAHQSSPQSSHGQGKEKAESATRTVPDAPDGSRSR
jgi:DNA-directed RNA polymerase specialized sigma24 family protein